MTVTPLTLTKSCTTCFESKPLDDYQRRSRSHDGRMSVCRDCNNAKKRANYAANPAPKIAATREYHLKNAEWSKATLAEWHQNNRARRYAAHKERLQSDPDYAKYRRELTAHSERRRRASKIATQVAAISVQQYADLLENYGGNCWICSVDLDSEALHWDHYVPLSRGGTHTLNNLRPSCGPCNLRKSNKFPFTEDMKNQIAAEVRALRASQADRPDTDGTEV